MRALVRDARAGTCAYGGGGVQNTLGGARGDSKNPQGILHPRSKYTRVFGMGVPKTGGAKFPMTPALDIESLLVRILTGVRMRTVQMR